MIVVISGYVDIYAKVSDSLARAPAWLKRDLLSSVEADREVAEECLATMISSEIAAMNTSKEMERPELLWPISDIRR
jgi:hypothetical protein